MADVRRPFRRPNGWYFSILALAIPYMHCGCDVVFFSMKEAIPDLMLFVHVVLTGTPVI
jgi:hypothetical protein